MILRLVPDLPLPPYAYVPGLHPHPVREPAGHSYGQHAPQPEPLIPAQWRKSRLYCEAIDLFNLGYYWESHEAWEGLWHAADRQGATADFLKGLIKLAAAGVKAREGLRTGVVSHSARAVALFDLVAAAVGAHDYAGLEFAELRRYAQQAPEALLADADEPCAVKIVFPFVLRPVD